MKYGFGVDVGGTTVKLAYFDTDGNMLDKWEIPTVVGTDGSQILPDIAASIENYIQKNNIDRSSLIGIGVGVPGPVNTRGVVNKCINLNWGVFNIEVALSQLTGLPVQAGNDANVAALGESWKGGGAGCDNVVMATLGTGVGGGIIIDGKMGCVEQYCSATGIVRIAKQFLSRSDAPCALRQIENLTCKDIFDAGKEGDTLALEILEQVYAYLGEFLANVCDVVNPEVVVIGGGVSKAGQCLIDGAKKYFDKAVFHAAKDVRFALASLGNDAGAYGAFKLILDA